MTLRSLASFIWKFVKQQRLVFFCILLLSIVWSLDTMIWPYILRLVIDILTQFDMDRGSAWEHLQFPVFFGVGLWLFIEYGFRLQGFLLARMIPRIEATIRMAMFDHVQHHSPKYFNEHFAGSLANKITDMTTQVTLILQQIVTIFFPVLVAFCLAIGFYYRINPLFSFLVIGWLIVHFSICIFFARKCDGYENIHGEVRSELLGKIVDSFTNNFAVNLFYRFRYEKEAIGVYQKEEQLKNYQAKKYVEMMRLFLGFFAFLVGGLSINGFMIYLWLEGRITTGEIAQIFNMNWGMLMMMWIAGISIPGFFQSIGIAKQALSLMHDPQDVVDLASAKPLSIKSGAIAFENVSFRYGQNRLFRDKNVQIRGGEKVGLVGYSGSGKSTFVNLILRFYPVEAGKIMIDGQDISHVTLESLRSQVALIPQDPILFHRSLRDNIRYGNIDASESQVMHAAQLAHCDEFIRRSPLGYDSLVGERGTQLSGGERQRIAIARAMLARAPILILDEATSALDSVTEKYIQESLEELMEGRTTIVIAHRLSTLARMDRILVFDQGEILEEGSHEQLLQLGKHYAHMWNMQVGGFLPDKNPQGF